MKPEKSCAASSETALQTEHAAQYANGLLTDLGFSPNVETLADHPALSYRRSGLLKTTGLMLPFPLASHIDGALMALKTLASTAEKLPNCGSLLLGERARLRETVRDGRFCAGGYGRLIETKDGLIALNLVREDDWDLIPAWLEDYAQNWDDIERFSAEKDADYLVERAAEIGLAVAKDEMPPKPESWFSIQSFTQAKCSNPLIVDLSGLWAGPLASSLLSLAGARVIKVESPTRPDGMRGGHQGFYSLLNAGKDCVALNFRDADDLEKLKGLLEKADIVIEASRPRALRQLGIRAEDFVARQPGKIWARLTAYGQAENRIGFGDDIGISAGLASIMGQAHGEPCFVGDAIADPVNGVHLALAIQAYLKKGGGVVIDLTMRDVLRCAMGDIPQDCAAIAREWQDLVDQDNMPLYQMREPGGEVKLLGADNEVWV
ncbi:CoA transferase [Hellea balneolensis]|uniref:CoA transferase n=1 Tax=Hellea balneolensis TaxID=287478 RepID=UPI000685BC24|nr:CoA transferase [Hellea balneolensis]